MGKDDSPVIDFAFTSISTSALHNLAIGTKDNDYIRTASGASVVVETSIYAIPENFLNVSLVDFMIPSDTMSVDGVSDLSNGKEDVVGMLYSSNNLYQYPTYPGDDQDAFDIGIQYN